MPTHFNLQWEFQGYFNNYKTEGWCHQRVQHTKTCERAVEVFKGQASEAQEEITLTTFVLHRSRASTVRPPGQFVSLSIYSTSALITTSLRRKSLLLYCMELNSRDLRVSFLVQSQPLYPLTCSDAWNKSSFSHTQHAWTCETLGTCLNQSKDYSEMDCILQLSPPNYYWTWYRKHVGKKSSSSWVILWVELSLHCVTWGQCMQSRKGTRRQITDVWHCIFLCEKHIATPHRFNLNHSQLNHQTPRHIHFPLQLNHSSKLKVDKFWIY